MKTTNLFDSNSFGIIKTNDSAYAILVNLGSKKYIFRVLPNSKGNPTTLCRPVGFDLDDYAWLKPDLETLVKKLGYRKFLMDVEQDFDPTTVKVLSIEPMPKTLKHLSDATIKQMCTDWGFDVPDEVTTDPHAYTGKYRDYSASFQDSEILAKFEEDKEKWGTKQLPSYLLATAEKLKRGLIRAVNLAGPAGTGKSTLAIGLAQYCGAPLLRFNGEPGTSRDDMMGIYMENPEYDGVNHTQRFQFNPGPIYEAAKKGYMVLLDEVNFITPESLSILNPLLDDTEYYSFSGITFKKHPNFALITTMNPGYKGTTELNDALKSRFTNVAVGRLKKAEFISWMKSSPYYRSEYSDKFFELLYDYQGFVQDFADSLMESASVCVRHSFNFLKSLTIKAFSFDEFVNEFVISYVFATAHWDGDTTASIVAFTETQEFKDKMNTLYNHYPYQVVEDVEEVFVDYAAWRADKEAGFVTPEPAEATKSGDVSLDDVFDGFDTLNFN